MYKVTVHRRAARYLKKLPSDEKDNVKKALRELAGNPFGSHEVKCMVGEWKGYVSLLTIDMPADAGAEEQSLMF